MTTAELRKLVDDLAPDGTFAAIDTLNGALRTIDDAAGDDAREVKAAALAQLFGHVAALGWLAYRKPGAIDALVEPLRGHRGLGAQVSKLLSRVDREAKSIEREAAGKGHIQLAHTSGSDETALGEQDDAPVVNRDFIVPPGYAVDSAAVYRAVHKDGQEIRDVICSAPIVVTGFGRDVETGECVAEVRWLTASAWHSKVLPLSVLGSTRSIVTHLRTLGAPVTDANARHVVHYLDHQLSLGLRVGCIREARSISRMGWVKVDGAWSFVWGREVIGPARLTVQAEGGHAQLADACCRGGTWDGYLRMMRKLEHAPGPWLMTWAAIASILIQPLDLPGYVIDLAGDTSKGKSTSLNVGLAAVGRTGEPKPGVSSLRGSWKDSVAHIERTAAFLANLPLSLDDSKERGSDEKVTRTLYSHSSSGEKGRGMPDGNRRRMSWRSLLLSNGEASVLSLSKDGGARARTLVVSGAPLGGETDAHGELAEELEAACKTHFGHLLPRIVQLILTSGAFDMLREHYDIHRSAAAESAAGNKVARRLSRLVAALGLARDLCASVGLEPPKGCDPLQIAMDACIGSGHDADKPKEALERLYAWAEANRDRFWWKGAKRAPPGGWVGRWDQREDVLGLERDTHWEWFGVFQGEVESVLDRQGFDVPNTISAWADRGWLDCPGGRHKAKKVTMVGGRPRMLVIRRAALEQGEAAAC